MAKTKLSEQVQDMDDTQVDEVKRGPKKRELTNAVLYEKLMAFKDEVLSESNRRQKAGEKWRELTSLKNYLVSAVIHERKLATGGKSSRMAPH
jgi:hypothetical protein